MGYNIHMYVERQREDGSWERIPDTKAPKHPYYDPAKSADHQISFDKPRWCVVRDYTLFGRLAGIGDHEVIPIAEPKGVPNDMSLSIAEEWTTNQDCWHNASYFNAKELLAVKDEPLRFKRYLSMKNYKEYLNTGKIKLPKNYFIWEWPKNLISNDEMERILSLMAFWDGTEYYTDLLFESPDIKLDMHLWEKIVPAMLAIEPDPEKVRIVFWFNSTW